MYIPPPVPLRPCYIRPERKKTVTRTDLNQHHFPRNIAEEDTLRSYLYHVISIKNRSLRSLLRKTWPSDEHRNPFPSPPLPSFSLSVNGSSIVVSVSCETFYVRISTGRENPGENFFLETDRTWNRFWISKCRQRSWSLQFWESSIKRMILIRF